MAKKWNKKSTDTLKEWDECCPWVFCNSVFYQCYLNYHGTFTFKYIQFGAEKKNVFPLEKNIKYKQSISNICVKASQTIDLIQGSAELHFRWRIRQEQKARHLQREKTVNETNRKGHPEVKDCAPNGYYSHSSPHYHFPALQGQHYTVAGQCTAVVATSCPRQWDNTISLPLPPLIALFPNLFTSSPDQLKGTQYLFICGYDMTQTRSLSTSQHVYSTHIIIYKVYALCYVFPSSSLTFSVHSLIKYYQTLVQKYHRGQPSLKRVPQISNKLHKCSTCLVLASKMKKRKERCPALCWPAALGRKIPSGRSQCFVRALWCGQPSSDRLPQSKPRRYGRHIVQLVGVGL